jgi:hypothetical protein
MLRKNGPEALLSNLRDIDVDVKEQSFHDSPFEHTKTLFKPIKTLLKPIRPTRREAGRLGGGSLPR